MDTSQPPCEHKTQMQEILQTVQDIKKSQSEQREQSTMIFTAYIYIYLIYFIYLGLNYACEYMYAVDPAEASPYITHASSSVHAPSAPPRQQMSQVNQLQI